MTATILLTGFGPFPGAPFNPTDPLVRELARAHSGGDTRRVAHVFEVSYAAVDRELPQLVARVKPDALVMFGLAQRSAFLRVETRARNVLTQALPDASGYRPLTSRIDEKAPVMRPLRAPAQRLLLTARACGVPAELSHDAGRYLCNYLCWRAAETAIAGGPQLTAFIHVPAVSRAGLLAHSRALLTFDDLIGAAEAIVRTATIAARQMRPPHCEGVAAR